jgi:hypothetical protein
MITDCIFDAAFNATDEPCAAHEGVALADVDLHHLAALEMQAYEATLYACDLEGEA